MNLPESNFVQVTYVTCAKFSDKLAYFIVLLENRRGHGQTPSSSSVPLGRIISRAVPWSMLGSKKFKSLFWQVSSGQ